MSTIDKAIEALRVEKAHAGNELTRLDEAIRALQTLVGTKTRAAPTRASKPKRKRRKMSAAARRKIATAQRARWSKIRKKKAV